MVHRLAHALVVAVLAAGGLGVPASLATAAPSSAGQRAAMPRAVLDQTFDGATDLGASLNECCPAVAQSARG
jgi:hypothetical protein